MTEEPKLRFTVDSSRTENLHSALPLSQIAALSRETIELSREAAEQSLNGALRNVLDLLASLDLQRPNVRVAEVKLSLAFGAGGKVSILSVAEGSVSGTAAIEFTIRTNE